MSFEASRFGFNYQPRSIELSFSPFFFFNRHVRVKGLKEYCKKSFLDHCNLSTFCCLGMALLAASAEALGVDRTSPSQLTARCKTLFLHVAGTHVLVHEHIALAYLLGIQSHCSLHLVVHPIPAACSLAPDVVS